jgi:hypothetical protein
MSRGLLKINLIRDLLNYLKKKKIISVEISIVNIGTDFSVLQYCRCVSGLEQKASRFCQTRQTTDD